MFHVQTTLFFHHVATAIELEAEREIYTVVEGTDLEVCVIAVRGVPIFGFSVHGHIITQGRLIAVFWVEVHA